MSDDRYPWNHHPERQVREIIVWPDGSASERMHFPNAVSPQYSYRPVGDTNA